MTGRDNFHRPEVYLWTDWPDRPADRHPETLAWIAKIEAERCAGTRRCTGPCDRVLPLTAEHFTRNRAQRGGGWRYVCRDCDATRLRARRQQEKVTAYRAISWRSA